MEGSRVTKRNQKGGLFSFYYFSGSEGNEGEGLIVYQGLFLSLKQEDRLALKGVTTSVKKRRVERLSFWCIYLVRKRVCRGSIKKKEAKGR